MNYLKYIIIILLLFTSGMSFCQKNKSFFYADIVIIKDLELIQTIESLTTNDQCISSRADLYIDYRNKDYIIFGQNSIKGYIGVYKKQNTLIYLTFINNRLLFILSKKESNLPIQKTDFKVDLSEFLEIYDFSIRDLSSWHLKKVNGSYEIINEKLFGCN